MKTLFLCLALGAALPAAGQPAQALDLSLLTAGELELLGSAASTSIQGRGALQRMLRECPESAMQPLLAHFNAADTEDQVYEEFRALFNGQLDRGDFDRTFRAGAAMAVDCSPANVQSAVRAFTEPAGPMATMKSLLKRIHWRQADVVPATVELALTRLQDLPAEQLSAEIHEYASHVSLQFAGQSGCTTRFRIRQVWSTELPDRSLIPSEFEVDWRTVGAVGEVGGDKPVTMLASKVDALPIAGFYRDQQRTLLGAFERLRLACNGD